MLSVKEDEYFIEVNFDPETFTMGDLRRFKKATNLQYWHDSVSIMEDHILFGKSRLYHSDEETKQIKDFVKEYNERDKK